MVYNCYSVEEFNSSQDVNETSDWCSKDEVVTSVNSISPISQSNKGSFGSRYSVEEEKLICNKLWAISILQEFGEARTSKETTKSSYSWLHWFLKEFSFEGNVRLCEIELLAKVIHEVADDFKHSRNECVKERTTTTLKLINMLIVN